MIPAFNGEETISESIESVVSQEYRPIEIIIVDDASEDCTLEKIEVFKQGDRAPFRVFHHNTNLGLAATLNHGIEESRGSNVLILHQDCVLAHEGWLDRALRYFNEEKVAVVTGYYGIPPKALNFATKAFGVFRRQFHTPSFLQTEEVTFSEGKCDLYRKTVLQQIGGFPERFRIAGEDLFVSFRIRQLGFMILKSYNLPVVQKFGRTTSLAGNLRKEFIFGKAMGGIFPMFKTFVFKNLQVSQYSRVRSFQRATQPLFVVSFIILLLLSSFLTSPLLLYSAITLLLLRLLFYLIIIQKELTRQTRIFWKSESNIFLKALLIAALGLVIDFVYTLGFSYGLLLYTIGARL